MARPEALQRILNPPDGMPQLLFPGDTLADGTVLGVREDVGRIRAGYNRRKSK